MVERESITFDVLIVGAGPAGLSAAIKLKQLNPVLTVCIVEKGSEVGAHILSGAVIDPKALTELMPDWQERNAPLHTKATEDNFILLTSDKALKLPTPPQMKNDGNYIISLSNLCRFLAEQATMLGVEIYPGFAAKEMLYDAQGAACGIVTGEFGVSRMGEHKANFQPAMEIRAGITLIAEGCRGSLAESIIQKFNLREESDTQTYGIGIKEIWEIDPTHHKQGKVTHTIGWPLDRHTYGGSFIYHLENNQVSVGFVTGLDYQNPYLNPFKEFQRFKTHPHIRKLLEGGRRIAYGARALNEGGYQSIPKLTFPGGALIGCSAGFLNVPKIKGIHTAMKSGMLAAESIIEGLENYTTKIQGSWVGKELYQARNIRPAFRYGLWVGLLYAAVDSFLLRGKAPWTFHHKKPDHQCTVLAIGCKKIDYPLPDGKVSFDITSSVYLANTRHEEDQPVHLLLKDAATPVRINLSEYDAPEQRYCPAGVYEIVYKGEEKTPSLQINAANCVHCKTCDIKDPTQNIVWTTPEGGSGPNYSGM